jgi:hypothetical protein
MAGPKPQQEARQRFPAGRALLDALNGPWHRRALQGFLLLVLAHGAEHLLQAYQVYALGWPRERALGLLGLRFPWLVTSEWLHSGYVFGMLVGLAVLRPAVVGRGTPPPGLASPRACAAPHPGDGAAEPLRLPGPHQPPPTGRAPRRTPSLLQRGCPGPDPARHVFPPLSARRGGAGTEVPLRSPPAGRGVHRPVRAPDLPWPDRRNVCEPAPVAEPALSPHRAVRRGILAMRERWDEPVSQIQGGWGPACGGPRSPRRRASAHPLV